MYARPVIKQMQILKFQVPIEKKEYLKDQREKIGPKSNKNLIFFHCIRKTSPKVWLSNLGACLSNAFLLDLQDMGFLNPSIPLKDILDKSKVDREKARVKVTRHQKHVQDYNNLICIGVDCSVDKDTLLYKITEENGDKKILKKQGTRERWALQVNIIPTEPYLTLVQLVFNLAEDVAAFLEEYNNVNTVKAVMVDNTSTNTGCDAGMVIAQEKKTKKEGAHQWLFTSSKQTSIKGHF